MRRLQPGKYGGGYAILWFQTSLSWRGNHFRVVGQGGFAHSKQMAYRSPPSHYQGSPRPKKRNTVMRPHAEWE